MWQSEDDVLRDLASLNDFGSPGDKDSYKILYSIGRGLKTKEKPRISDKFIDSRTGEAINIDDGVLDTDNTYYKSKGRGSVLGSFFRTKLQLQQQLRLARPLGSSDEAIESYYGRSRSEEIIQSSTDTLDSEPPTQNTRIIPERLNGEIRKRVKATRNSNLQVNALINGLLSKHKIESEKTAKQNFISDIKNEQLHFENAEEYNRNDNIDNKQNIALNDTNILDLAVSLECNEDISASEKNANHFKESTSKIPCKEHIVLENLKIIDDDEEKEQQKKETTKRDRRKQEIENDFGFNDTESENDRDLKYRALGERLNKLRETYSSTTRNYSASFSEFSVPTESVVFNEEDFPPLNMPNLQHHWPFNFLNAALAKGIEMLKVVIKPLEQLITEESKSDQYYYTLIIRSHLVA